MLHLEFKCTNISQLCLKKNNLKQQMTHNILCAFQQNAKIVLNRSCIVDIALYHEMNIKKVRETTYKTFDIKLYDSIRFRAARVVI